MKSIVIALFASVFLVGCAHLKESKDPLSFKIISPQIRLAGSAFVCKNFNDLKAQVYSAGAIVGNFKANLNRVCMNNKCFHNNSFNKYVLGIDSSEAIMYKLLNFKRLETLNKDLTTTGGILKFSNKSATQHLANSFTTFRSKSAVVEIRKFK